MKLPCVLKMLLCGLALVGGVAAIILFMLGLIIYVFPFIASLLGVSASTVVLGFLGLLLFGLGCMIGWATWCNP
jgi:hypothetical protein